MHKRIVTLLAGSILLAGCQNLKVPYTEAPVATNFEKTEQSKLQSAAHWQQIAQDTAAQLAASLPSDKRTLYIRQSAEDSKFQRAFNQKLMSALIASGYAVMKHSEAMGSVTVEVKTDYVKWADRAKRDAVMGEITMLTGGLWVLRNIYVHGSPGAAMMGAAVSADAYFAANSKLAKGSRPKHELVVSVVASDNNRFYANETNVYYTTEKDFYNYASQLPASRLQVKEN
ncbi:MAG: hypothetical protein GXZ05_06605 [Gammaproteobacteria bacterium]|nr:hypothetical protein [Gammaproteobacteria bacterium]